MSSEALVSDGVLLALVRSVNGLPETTDPIEGLGLVLFVGGNIVSGRLIPNWLWFRKVANGIRKQEESEGMPPSGLREMFNYFEQEMVSAQEDNAKISEVIDKVPERARDALANVDRTELIHLEDARVFQPGHPGMPGNGMLWRGRLSEISGWSLGVFTPQ